MPTTLTVLTTKGFTTAHWYRRTWLWFKRLIGFGEVIMVGDRKFRIKSVKDDHTILIK